MFPFVNWFVRLPFGPFKVSCSVVLCCCHVIVRLRLCCYVSVHFVSVAFLE